VNELDAALMALDRIAQAVAEGEEVFEESPDRQFAMIFLWVNVGSLLKQYCRGRGIPLGSEPFAGPIRMRDKLLYGPIAGLRTDIVWETCASDAPTLRVLLSDLLAAEE
jgi:uncharacterized protein with HEPN domain